jgi:hypothetical protein
MISHEEIGNHIKVMFNPDGTPVKVSPVEITWNSTSKSSCGS